MSLNNWYANEEIQLFREYLQIKTAQPNVDYTPCVTFLRREANRMGLPINVHYPASPKKPVVVITWIGTEPNLPSIVLNSHMDVVPADEEYWTHSPFAAEIDDAGRIYSRGTQDMKGMSIQYLAAIRSLQKDGIQMKRTIHLMFVPDEEIGGILGMKEFIKTKEFQAMNVGFSLDEGHASPTDVYPIYYAERAVWRVHFKIKGTAGHGSMLLENTVGEKLNRILNEFMDFRTNELNRMKKHTDWTVGNITTVNLTLINGGHETNVVPSDITAVFDVRVAVDRTLEDMENIINSWANAGGNDIEITYKMKDPKIPPTVADDTNPFWTAIINALTKDLNLTVENRIRPGIHLRIADIFEQKNMSPNNWYQNEEIQLFREYLQIKSVQPDVDYTPCITFLRREANRMGLPINVHYPASPKKPVVVITWIGTEPKLPSIVLNSHMDVVPADEEYWTHPPFAAEIDDDGRIYSRGTQDMKGISIQYLAAIRSLQKDGIRMKRTIHLMFVPDEEIGGILGMKEFITTKEFQAMNVGFSLDEGNASATDVYPIYYAERAVWRVQFKIKGTAGHGSMLLENTVGEKLNLVLNEFMKFRTNELKRMKEHTDWTVGNITTVNLTLINGGHETNVVPSDITLVFDVRVAVDRTLEDMENIINSWANAGGNDIEITYIMKDKKIPPTVADDRNPFWTAITNVLTNDLNLKIQKCIRPGVTDSRHLRAIGIPSFGFTPLPNTPVLLHANDEYIGAKEFLNGIKIYAKVFEKIANV